MGEVFAVDKVRGNPDSWLVPVLLQVELCTRQTSNKYVT